MRMDLNKTLLPVFQWQIYNKKRGRKHMTDNSKKNTKSKETYIYDTEGHYTWHSSFTEALKGVKDQITRKE